MNVNLTIEAPEGSGIKHALEAARVKYTGHGEKTGGLQQHSIGDLYPFVSVVQEGVGHCLLDSRTGGELQGYPSYEVMAQDASVMLNAGRRIPQDKKILWCTMSAMNIVTGRQHDVSA